MVPHLYLSLLTKEISFFYVQSNKYSAVRVYEVHFCCICCDLTTKQNVNRKHTIGYPNSLVHVVMNNVSTLRQLHLDLVVGLNSRLVVFEQLKTKWKTKPSVGCGTLKQQSGGCLNCMCPCSLTQYYQKCENCDEYSDYLHKICHPVFYDYRRDSLVARALHRNN